MPFLTRKGHRLWQGCLSGGLCLAVIPAAAAHEHGASPAKDPPAPGVEVEVTGGLLTLDADGAPLAEVLRAIGEAGGFEVVLRGGLATPVRESFAHRPLEDALRRLLAGHAVVIVHEAPDTASGAAALARIAVTENRSALDAGSAQAPASDAAEARPDDADDDVALDRAPAAIKAGARAPREVIETASRAFANIDATVRSRAVAALARLKGPGARRLLRDQALGDEEPRLRMQALRTLAAAKGERAINVVAQALRDDPAPGVRMSAVRALGQIGGDRARRILKRAARDLDPAISLAAEQALAAWPAED